MTRAALAMAFVACSISAVVGQQPKPSFEVASVKPQRTPLSIANMATQHPRVRPGGGFSASHATVATLVPFAYDLQPFQLVGVPDWAGRDAFDISARAASDAPVEQVRLMVQSLLEERFGLVVRKEQRDDCTAAAAAEVQKRFPPRTATTADGMIHASCGTMPMLANLLSIHMEMPVIDHTGLSGRFTYSILGVSLQPPLSAATDAESKWPSVPVALEEQLGLKLESRRGPVDVLVIDSVHQPTEN